MRSLAELSILMDVELEWAVDTLAKNSCIFLDRQSKQFEQLLVLYLKISKYASMIRRRLELGSKGSQKWSRIIPKNH